MMWKRVALLSMLVAVWGCAEGGGRGSGIFTSVAGNVVSIGPTTPRAATDLSGIVVTVEGTAIAARTDDDGVFALHGAFDGMVTVAFALPDDGGAARIAVNVPTGGTLTLNNVALDTQQGSAIPETADVDFTGVITTADCATRILVMVSAPGDADSYVVQLDTSSLQDAHGTPVPCQAVHAGQRASVQGMVNPDGTFGEATIVLQD